MSASLIYLKYIYVCVVSPQTCIFLQSSKYSWWLKLFKPKMKMKNITTSILIYLYESYSFECIRSTNKHNRIKLCIMKLKHRLNTYTNLKNQKEKGSRKQQLSSFHWSWNDRSFYTLSNTLMSLESFISIKNKM